MNPICAGHVEGFRKSCVCICIEHAPIFVVSLAAAAFRLSRLNPLLLGRPLDQCARIDACVLAQADDDGGPELAPPSCEVADLRFLALNKETELVLRRALRAPRPRLTSSPTARRCCSAPRCLAISARIPGARTPAWLRIDHPSTGAPPPRSFEEKSLLGGRAGWLRRPASL